MRSEAAVLLQGLRALRLDQYQSDPPPIHEEEWRSQGSQAKSFEALHVIDLHELAVSEPEPPRSILQDGGMPEGDVTLWAANGGMGKSNIALYCAVCIALERPFFGLRTSKRKVMFVSYEDDRQVLHWRLRRICDWLGVGIDALLDQLTLIDVSRDDDAPLITETRDGLEITPAYACLKRQITSVGAKVLIVDGASDAFDANENQRRSVRRFIRSLRKLIPEDGACLLLAHVDKATARNSDTSHGYSGSTAWSNSVRARWYLSGDIGDSLLLELQKSNHGRTGTQIRLRWNDAAHLFVGELAMPVSKLARELADLDEREALLGAFRACAHSAPVVIVPAAMTGPRTAHHVLCARPEFPESLRSGKAAIRRFWQQIEQLRAMGAIVESSIRRSDRHYMRQLTIPTEQARACGQ